MMKPVCDTQEMCPLFKSKRSLVCHKCAWYQHVRGHHPQTGEEMDKWECAIALMPMLLIENSRQQHVNNSAITSLREETIKGKNKEIAATLLRTQAILKLGQQK